MGKKKGRATRREKDETEHRFALDDLQDAVDSTMADGALDERLANLRRASRREAAAREALKRRR